MNSTSIKTKLALLLGGVAFANLAILAFTIIKIANIESTIAVFDQTGVEVQLRTIAVARDVNYVSRLTRSIMLGDDLDKNVEALNKTIADIQKSFEAMDKALVKLPDDTQKTRIGEQIGKSRQDTLRFVEDGRDRMLKLKSVSRTPEGLALAWADYQKNATPLANTARDSFKRLSDEATNYLNATRAEVHDTFAAMKRINLALQLSLSALVLLSGFFLVRSIMLRLHEAVETANRVAQGDLTGDIRVDGDDELGALLSALSTMQCNLKTLIAEMTVSADHIANAAGEFVAKAATVDDASSQQSEAANAVAAAIEQLTVSVNHIAESAHTARGQADESKLLCSQGNEVTGSATVKVQTIAATINDSSEVVSELLRQSESISSIVSAIREISDQTSLLALNAAIEAARAGETGRGFAVVADEVRKLAERTQRATEEIAQLIASVQTSSRDVSVRMHASVAEAKDGVELSDKAGDAITQIRSRADGLSGLINDISTSLLEQSSASTEIAQRIEKIAQMSEENTASVSAIKASSHELSALAQTLRGKVSRFKTDALSGA